MECRTIPRVLHNISLKFEYNKVTTFSFSALFYYITNYIIKNR